MKILLFIYFCFFWTFNLKAISYTPRYFSPPAKYSEAIYLKESPIEVLKEDLSIKCKKELERIVCYFEANYFLNNPSDQNIKIFAGFYGLDSEINSVTLDKEKVLRNLNSKEIEQLDNTTLQKVPGFFGHNNIRPRAYEAFSKNPRMQRFGITITLVSKEQKSLVIKGKMKPNASWYRENAYANSAIRNRHRFFTPKYQGFEEYKMRYFLSPLLTWKLKGPVNLSLIYPEEYITENPLNKKLQKLAKSESKDGQKVVKVSFKPSQQKLIPLNFKISHQQSFFVGASLGVAFIKKFKTRLTMVGKYKKSPLTLNLSLDIDKKGIENLAPLVKLNLPSVLLVPSFGLGIGMPFSLKKDNNFGMRLLFDLVFYGFGVSLNYDYWKENLGNGYSERSIFLKISL